MTRGHFFLFVSADVAVLSASTSVSRFCNRPSSDYGLGHSKPLGIEFDDLITCLIECDLDPGNVRALGAIDKPAGVRKENDIARPVGGNCSIECLLRTFSKSELDRASAVCATNDLATPMKLKRCVEPIARGLANAEFRAHVAIGRVQTNEIRRRRAGDMGLLIRHGISIGSVNPRARFRASFSTFG